MKQIKIAFVAILLTLSANAGWKSIKKLGHYGPKAYTLKKGVGYVEIRKYTKSTGTVVKTPTSSRTKRVLRMYRQSLSSYGTKTKSAFQKISPKKRHAFKKGEWSGLATQGSWYHNGFMLDVSGKQWRLENARDVTDMVRPINTSAEISLVLWLHSDAQSNARKWSAKYRKSGKGYIVKEHYIINDSAYGCGDYRYQYKISRSGKITQKKLLSKKAVKECGGE